MSNIKYCFGASRFAPFARSRWAIRSITFTAFISFMRFGGSAAIPLAEKMKVKFGIAGNV
jgi:hypothetical protein